MSVMFGIDSTVLLFGVVIAVVICVVVVVVRKIRSRAKSDSRNINMSSSRTPLHVRKIPASSSDSSSDQDTVFASPSRQKEVDSLGGKVNISESLTTLAEKYSLDEITLSTSDGLLLASSRKTPSADAIARYSEMYAGNLRPWPPGIILFGLEHKGSLLVGIAKTKDLLVQDADQDLIRETKDILNRWI